MANTSAELAKLEMERSRAASRVGDLERSYRDAVEQSRTASAQLAEVERSGATAPTRHKVEEQLASAKAKAAEPWAERIAGAKAAARDVEQRYRGFVGGNLGELVQALEADGQVAAARVNGAASELIAAHSEWERIATQMGSLIALVALPTPGDVSYPRSVEAARAALALANQGGEEGPQLDRNRPPWDTLLGASKIAEAVEPVPA